jgi:ergothioneine biosynthesis protein EgtB
MELLVATPADEELSRLVTLGLHHEQQHQELLLTDIKHLFSCNPLLPAYAASAPQLRSSPLPLEYIGFAGGLHCVGSEETAGFCFDNETPRHTTYLQDFALANRLVTNGEYLEFVRDGGYRSVALWLSDGWSLIQSQHWDRPLYWNADHSSEFTLHGATPLDPAKPVSHLSFYEVDAFARWSNARLPREEEWEVAASSVGVTGNLLERGALHPQAATESGLTQMYGDVWEWTASAYSPYPGYSAQAGALGEYNGKFMVSQLVLRGGSCVTSASHIRAGYRNFFYPQARWQFTGLRLAKGL